MNRAENKAVFLSYASQDAAAVERIAEALRATGVEVWFDRNELVGGDAWDAKIRKQIAECALFVPIISASTQARLEGYFRLEWKLAAQRTHMMAEAKPFLLPVVIDATRDAEAHVPAEFKAVQWTHLPPSAFAKPSADTSPGLRRTGRQGFGGQAHPLGGPEPGKDESADPALVTLVARVQTLLGGSGMEPGRTVSNEIGKGVVAPASQEAPFGPPGRRQPLAAWLATGAAVLAAVAFVFWSQGNRLGRSAEVTTTAARSAVSPEVVELLVKVAVMVEKDADCSRDEWLLAESMAERAVKLEPGNALAWAAYADAAAGLFEFYFDRERSPRTDAQKRAQHALSLAPDSDEAKLALANCYRLQRQTRNEAGQILRELIQRRPNHRRALRCLAATLRTDADSGEEGLREALALYDWASELPGGDPIALLGKAIVLADLDRVAEADEALDRSLALRKGPAALVRKISNLLLLHGDVTQACELVRKLPGSYFLREDVVENAARAWLWAGDGAKCYGVLNDINGWKDDFVHDVPRGFIVGQAMQLLGRTDAARLAWRQALETVDRNAVAVAGALPNPLHLHWKALLHAHLGETEAATKALETYQQLTGRSERTSYLVAATCAALGRRAEALDALEHAINARIRTYFDGRNRALVWRASLRHDPMWAPLRGEARFRALVERASQRTATPAAANQVTAAPPGKSVAVLAFDNRSDDKANEYFSDGISEELAVVLGKVPGLRVAGWASTMAMKGAAVPEAEVARRLGVTHIVSGSVQKSGLQVRITARLVNAADGFQLWSDRFNREAKDIFALQEEIAGLIAQHLQLHLGVGARRERAVNPEAHRLVLEGRHYRNRSNDDGFLRAESSFQRALEQDPAFAEAYAGLAAVYAVRATYRQRAADAPEVVDDLRRARAAAEKAVQFGPELAEAHAVLAYTRFMQGEDAPARRGFERALLLNPNSAPAVLWSTAMHLAEGRLDATLRGFARVEELDPLWFINLHLQAEALFFAGRHPEALRLAERAAQLRSDGFIPNLALRAQILLALGRRDEARELAREIRRNPHVDTRWAADAAAIYVLRETGEQSEAAAYAAEMLPRLELRSQTWAQVQMAAGDLEAALPRVGFAKATEFRFFYWDPIWDPVRSEPRFLAKLEEMGLAARYRLARETREQLLREAAAAR